jgi:hypothetical protein
MKTMALVLACLSLLSAGPAAPIALRAAVGGPILLDGRCEADEWARATRVPAGPSSELLLQEDARFLYLCVTLPPDSFGTIDLYLLPQGESAPWDLHASAQLGERRRAGKDWPEWAWGNHRGWASPAVPFRGMKEVEGKTRPDFGVVKDREIQIDKQRFAGPRWQVMFELRALGAYRKGSLVFPEKAQVEDPSTWAMLTRLE